MPVSRSGQKNKDPIEIRRARGEISCAECRRHKLRCNRAIPCSTCIRKGCEDICPNGTLAPTYGQSARNSSRDSDTQTQKLLQMTKRIRQLEDALQIAHSSVSTTTHHLLSEGLLKNKYLLEQVQEVKREDASDEDTIDSVGTLAMLGPGIESYVGTDEFVVNFFGAAEPMHFKVDPALYSSAFLPNETFPFKPLYLPAQEIQAQIEEKLPSFERASALIEAYLENTSWLLRIVHRAQIMEELMPHVYRRRRAQKSSASDDAHRTDPHMLASLLAVFACGAAADMTLPPFNEEANLYYHLAWTAISLRSVFEGSSIHTVQALAVLGNFDIFSCQKSSLEGTWKLVSFCMSLAASIGLHRDPAHFKLSPKLIQRRRQLFWELHNMDIWKSIGSGRPMSLPESFVDCELPEDMEATVSEDGTTIPSIWAIRCRFAKEVMAEVVEKLGSARSLKYSEILRLDQKIRDFGPEEIVNRAVDATRTGDGRLRNELSGFLMVLLKDASLLLLHRNFFVRALAENPTNPTQSHFAPSFLATYHSAGTMLRTLRGLFQTSTHFIARIWPVWAHAICACVMLGSVAACGKASVLAPQAFAELNQAIEMIEKVQIHPLIKNLMPMVFQLRDRAYQALSKHDDDVQTPRRVLMNHRPSTEDGKESSTVGGIGRVLGKDIEGRVGGSRRDHRNYLEAMARSATSPSVSSVFKGDSEGPSRPSGGSEPLPDGTPGNSSRSARESPIDISLPRMSTQSTGTPSTPSLMDDTREMLQPSPNSISSRKALESLLSVSISRGETRSVPDARNELKRGQHPGPLPSRGVVGGPGDQRLDKVQTPHSDSSLEGGRLSTPSHPVASGLGFNDSTTEMQIDPNAFSFDFDSLPLLSPTTWLNSDFDVSFDMRASTGGESVGPSIPDDLAACRAIFQDSRFFGNETTTSENEMWNGHL